METRNRELTGTEIASIDRVIRSYDKRIAECHEAGVDDKDISFVARRAELQEKLDMPVNPLALTRREKIVARREKIKETLTIAFGLVILAALGYLMLQGAMANPEILKLVLHILMYITEYLFKALWWLIREVGPIFLAVFFALLLFNAGRKD
jgi:hypothetical protein